MKIAEEIRVIMDDWLNAHPRYGVIAQTLYAARVRHEMAFVGTDGCIYPISNVNGVTVEDTDTPKAHYADPKFLDDVITMLEAHIADCHICQGILLRTSI